MAHSETFEELATLQALGLPLGDEAAEFAGHLQDGCATCEQLLIEFREAATAFAAEAPPRRPRPEVKERLLASLGPTRIAVRPPASGGFLRSIIGLAAALLLVLVVTDDLRLRRQREELASRTAQLAEHLENAKRDLARRDLRVKVLESDDVKMLFLDGKDPQPSARAKVFWSEKAKRGIVVAGNLAPLPPDKQYELWVFAEGKPVPAGVFDVDSAGRALFESPELSSLKAAQNFAVTVEPRGGVPQPTGPIVLVGKPS
jgi:anti-sigma-K factor RskA